MNMMHSIFHHSPLYFNIPLQFAFASKSSIIDMASINEIYKQYERYLHSECSTLHEYL